MTDYGLAVIPGDGIGPAVTDAALDVLDRVADDRDFELSRTRYNWGSKRYLQEGATMPDDGLDRLRDADAIFLGAVGHPEVSDHVTLNGLLLPIRKGFDQYVCKRPNVRCDSLLEKFTIPCDGTPALAPRPPHRLFRP